MGATSSRHAEPAAGDGGGQAAEAADARPVAVVERFLDRLRATDSDGAAALLATDVAYENKGMPTLHGRGRVRRALRAVVRSGAEVELHVHSISAAGASVLTERTDVLQWGRMRLQFWVCGRFDVRDGEIVLWRDYFDYLAIFTAFARGLLGVVIPAARAKPPPGRLATEREPGGRRQEHGNRAGNGG
jgi:limonene-1,2-epoxide hydrolase